MTKLSLPCGGAGAISGFMGARLASAGQDVTLIADSAEAQTVFELISHGADDAEAIAAPGRRPLTFSGLRQHVADLIEALNRLGLGRPDRVAIVLSNGPEMATAFVAVAAGATAATLNPAYRSQEFEFYLTDLDARALIVEAGSDSPAIGVARARAIPVIRLKPRISEAAGLFDLEGETTGRPTEGGLARPEDVALVLHTSGTTSRPKMVPLSQRNLCASARNIRETLGLTAADRCLNIMPLFHIHGLMASVLASLSAGASVFCTPGFNAFHFLASLEEGRPTWYTAVPTMHQAILVRAERNPESARRSGLRFIRSSSASLPPKVMLGLEELFGVPVIESYGMTEAAHQITSNPLPPRQRKPGTVGIAAGPEFVVMDEAGRRVPPGMPGEVMIRGDNVIEGYEGDAEANAAAFVDGWFPTGDQGITDAEGYLTITGRLKEIINRGGANVSPLEVEKVLMDHPAVAEAVTFAVPDDFLGEDVAAAVVLRENMTASAGEIRNFAAERLAHFKRPRRILIVDEIPKGATGKLQRSGLAEKLGLGL